MKTIVGKDVFPWALATLSLGLAVALCSSTFLRDRDEMRLAQRQIMDQQKTISELNAVIERMNRDILSMQSGITGMQQEIIRLRQK